VSVVELVKGVVFVVVVVVVVEMLCARASTHPPPSSHTNTHTPQDASQRQLLLARLFDLGIHAALTASTDPIIPLLVFEDVLDVTPIVHCEKLWEVLENRRDSIMNVRVRCCGALCEESHRWFVVA
jgi:hypothetical protein